MKGELNVNLENKLLQIAADKELKTMFDASTSLADNALKILFNFHLLICAKLTFQ